MSQEIKHTPLPYRKHDHKDKRHNELAIMADNGNQYDDGAVKIASILGSKLGHVSYETAQANAEFIVRACNSHYELLELCKQCAEQFRGETDAEIELIKLLNKAIAKAEDKYQPRPVFEELHKSLKAFQKIEPEISKIIEDK